VAQRLVRKICEKCKVQIKPNAEIEKTIRDALSTVDQSELEGIDMKALMVYAARGCPACGNSGFKGRIGIYEVLPISKGIQNLINDRKPANTILDYALKEEKMILMNQDGILKALRGLTTVEEVARATKD